MIALADIAHNIRSGKNVFMPIADLESMIKKETTGTIQPSQITNKVIRLFGSPVICMGDEVCIFSTCTYCGTQKLPKINNTCSRCGAPVFPGSYGNGTR